MQLNHQNSHGSTHDSLKDPLTVHQAQSHRLSSGNLVSQSNTAHYQQQQQYNSFLAARRLSASTQNSIPSSCDAVNLAKEAQTQLKRQQVIGMNENAYANIENVNYTNVVHLQNNAQYKNGGNYSQVDSNVDLQQLEYLQNLQSLQNQNMYAQHNMNNFTKNAQSFQAQDSNSNAHVRLNGQANSSAISKNGSRPSNLQNYGMQQRMQRQPIDNDASLSYVQDTSVLINQSVNQNNSSQVINFSNPVQPLRHSTTSKNSKNTQIAFDQIQPQSQVYRDSSSNHRGGSGDPAPRANAVASQGSAGSHGSFTYQRGNITGSGLTRSRTTQPRSKYLAMIRCPCSQNETTDNGFIRASRGKKEKPIVYSSNNTANCGRCGQFYAVKDSKYTHMSASGRKQITSNAQIVKTVRSADMIFKVEEPIGEIFHRMKLISEKIKQLSPHPLYLEKRVRRIDNLSYIADCLQSDNQTIHHAVHLMDVYSSKMPKNKEYDTILISLCCLLISTKFLQIKYPGADALNDMVQRRYTADLIIAMEGKVLDTINWELLAYPIYDYVKMFISQGCLFENEEILKNATVQEEQKERDRRPTTELAAHFKKYAEFFADFCLYQESLMTVDAYNLACAIVAYTRKYMGVAIVWSTEMILLSNNQYIQFSDLYEVLEKKYTEAFPEHASSPNFPSQQIVEPAPQQTAPCPVRKNIVSQLNLSSDGKRTQGSSNKPVSNNKHAAAVLDLKTPDKCVFDFNSGVDKFSHEKFQINSNSVEKFRLQKNKNSGNTQNLKINEVSNNKNPAQVFSDNKRESINAQSFKQMIQQNQMATTFSDEKSTAQANNNANYLPYQKRAYTIKSNADLIKQIQDVKSSQKSRGSGRNHTRNSQVGVINSTGVISSPSANIDDAGTEQEVPPTKPMIIKSNSQAIGGGYVYKTTTKKSPKGEDLEKINALKESMNAVSITAKLPSSTTNQTGTKVNLNFGTGSFNQLIQNKRQGVANSYGNLGFNGHGPIKINQKLNVMGSLKKVENGSTAKKSKKSGKTQGTSSSQKMKMTKSYTTRITSNNSQTLNNAYHQRIAEQRANKPVDQALRDATQIQRNTSCTSHNQKRTNPSSQSYVSGKPKACMGNYVYQLQPQGDHNEGNSQEIHQVNSQGRSVLSVKNEAQIIKRKSSFANGPQLDLRVNVNKAQVPHPTGSTQASQIVQPTSKIGKNVPNGLLRKATGGIEGRQTSIGKLSYYRSNSNNGIKDYKELAKQINKEVNARTQEGLKADAYGSGDYAASLGNPQMSITNAQVNAPAIMAGTISKNKSFSNGTTSLDKTKSFMKMIHDQGVQSNEMQQTYYHSSERPQHQSQEGKPIQKLIKSGSQVLGKQRSRLNLTKKELLKQLNDQKDKISHMVDAANANANRCTSNEKTTSTKKPNHTELIGNIGGVEMSSQFNIQNQLFSIKSSQTTRGAQLDAQVSYFEAMNSHSAERQYTADGSHVPKQSLSNLPQFQDENVNCINRNQQLEKQSVVMQHQKMNIQQNHSQRYQDQPLIYKQNQSTHQQQFQNYRA